jgi:hypothetical protein
MEWLTGLAPEAPPPRSTRAGRRRRSLTMTEVTDVVVGGGGQVGFRRRGDARAAHCAACPEVRKQQPDTTL